MAEHRMHRKRLVFKPLVLAILASACGSPAKEPLDASVRLVQTTMQRELRQRWLRVDRPAPDTLRLTFQDEGLRKASPDELRRYAHAAAARSLALLAPPPASLPRGLRVVSVRIERSHRLGPLAWLANVTTYTLDTRTLRPMRGVRPLTHRPGPPRRLV